MDTKTMPAETTSVEPTSIQGQPADGLTADVSATLRTSAVRADTSPARRIPLAFGDANIPAPPVLIEALATHAHLNAYGPVEGSSTLRAAAAGYWARRGLATDPENVLAGPGSKALLYALVLSLGGPIAIPQPSWISYAAQLRMIGTKPVSIPISDHDGGIPDPGTLAAIATAARQMGTPLKAVIVTLPDNPTGTLARPETVEALCAVAREHEFTIVSDEIYRDLVHDPAQTFLSPSQLAPERTVVTTGLSKNLALGGWRIGIARFPSSELGDELKSNVLGIGSEIWSCGSTPVQEAAAHALSEPPEITEYLNSARELHAKVAQAAVAVFRSAGALTPLPAGAFYLYPDFEPLQADLWSARQIGTGTQLVAHLRQAHGIEVLPARDFGEHHDPLRLRVATSQLYGTTSDQRAEALNSSDPANLPWISDQLHCLEEALRSLCE
ncbi:pyridoxal phosphate-dependent aminotransferase [Spirillospora sp. NPDC048911]|uniref:pyridoxal phosphate-dependent aminotransferase n=1 Tax=Spirillospora sp. NPDC048911 TaxID=3364527 RepID=UPI00371ACBDD